MKYVFFVITLAVFVPAGFPQQPKPKAKATAAKKPAPAAKKPSVTTAVKKDEKVELEKALALENAEQKVAALIKFLQDFPKTDAHARVIDFLTAARVAAAQAKFETGEREGALKFARKAIEDAPLPFSEKLFAEAISKVPAMLFFHGEAAAAYETAAAIEKNSAASAPQLMALAGFYLSTENGTEAKRLAEAAIKVDERSAGAYQTLGMAHRLNFDLEASAAAYERAVELDPESVPARHGLAEMKRALGKSDDAVAIFSALIEKDATDLRAINGRILSLFDAGRRADAETELTKALEADPVNFVLLAGAAYWYAANGENARSIDLAVKAIAAEPRYIWSHIALARGLSGDGRSMDAEQVLLKAKKYGNFPTLDYEIASTKFAAGFYREAADELQKSFTVRENAIVTNLGRRIERSDRNFIDLLAAERRASILQPKAADQMETAEKMKALLAFRVVLSDKVPDETKAAQSAAFFADGTDKMRFHRLVFAAAEMVERSLAPAKVLELTKAAVASVEDGLNIPMPSGAIMANELYLSRTSAIAADKYVTVPEVPKATLSAIARGRIEELAGAALIQQKNNAEAAIRLRRAISILPEKSAWWRASLWRLGTALEADGKDKEALDAYVKSYTSADPDAGKFAVIEGVYKRVNGGNDGLEALIGANPAKPSDKPAEIAAVVEPEAKNEAAPEIKNGAVAETKKEATSEKKPETVNDKSSDPAVSPQPEKDGPKLLPSPSPEPEAKKSDDEKQKAQMPDPTLEPSPKPVETVQKAPEPVPSPSADLTSKSDETTKKPVEADPKLEAVPTTRSNEEKAPETKEAQKPLFEPVVIEVKNEKAQKPNDPTDQSNGEKKEDRSGASRARVVAGKEIVADAPPLCTLSVSQDNISLITGGSVGILVGLDNGDIKEIKFASSSPKDVEVIAEPEIAGVSGRALFVIKSLSTAIGVYQVVFTSSCGKKEILVRVR